MQTDLKWFMPTFHGDLLLEKKGPKLTSLRAYDLTPTEEKAMQKLRSRSVSPKLLRPWAKEADFLPLTNAAYRTSDGVTIMLEAKIQDVQSVLAKALKPERALLTAVRFSDGKIEETKTVTTPEGEVVQLPEPPKEAAQPVVAATVARPVNGCPMPAFNEADVRANRVLESFLSAEQIEDYRRTGAFITVGADSGHRYMICNRERPTFMKRYLGGRQMWDMEDQRAICIHDWAVPPPEEMLALHLMLICQGNETAMLKLPDVFLH